MRERHAWVVFTNQTDLPFLKIFKHGFRHCFVVINDGNNWLSIDPMANYMDVVVHHMPPEFDLPNWLRKRGYNVVSARINVNIDKPAPFMLFTCVEACKRVLGIHQRFILTPWQFYKYLNN